MFHGFASAESFLPIPVYMLPVWTGNVWQSSNFPQTPVCCPSGMYTLDECGCCLTCAKDFGETCGGPFQVTTFLQDWMSEGLLTLWGICYKSKCFPSYCSFLDGWNLCSVPALPEAVWVQDQHQEELRLPLQLPGAVVVAFNCYMLLLLSTTTHFLDA